MGKLVISLGGTVLREVELLNVPMSFGRRPTNDVVLDNMAISGQHARLLVEENRYVVEDSNSTNGTNVNGKSVKRVALRSGDLIEMGRYQIKLTGEPVAQAHASPEPRPEAATPKPPAEPAKPAIRVPKFEPYSPDDGAVIQSTNAQPAAAVAQSDSIGKLRILSGPNVGKEMPLKKAMSTLGRKGVFVVGIRRQTDGYFASVLESSLPLRINGRNKGSGPVKLRSGDMLEVLRTKVQFLR